MLLGDARHKPNRNPGNFSGLDASSTSLGFAPANVDCGEESMRSLERDRLKLIAPTSK